MLVQDTDCLLLCYSFIKDGYHRFLVIEGTYSITISLSVSR
jgi:hypothetical protein